MKIIKKILKTVFIASFVGYIILIFWHPKLPDSKSIIPELYDFDPIQTTIKNSKPYSLITNGQTYQITPLFDYQAKGLVVAEYDAQNWLDYSHKNDPAQTKDLCLIWGNNLKNGVYRDLEYKHGEFTCYVYWNEDQVLQFNGNQLANNHLIPKNEKLAELIKTTHIGDQVMISGQLVNYSILDKNGQISSNRNTSIVRDDHGCEIVLVSDFQILQKSFPYPELKSTLGYSAVIFGLLNLILFLFI